MFLLSVLEPGSPLKVKPVPGGGGRAQVGGRVRAVPLRGDHEDGGDARLLGTGRAEESLDRRLAAPLRLAGRRGREGRVAGRVRAVAVGDGRVVPPVLPLRGGRHRRREGEVAGDGRLLEVGEAVGQAPGVGLIDAHRERQVRALVVVQGEADLLHVVRATHPGRRFADLLHGRQKEADQNGNDGNDHQQLNQRESPAAYLLRRSNHKTTPRPCGQTTVFR